MSIHRIHVFISHSWKYPHHYETLSRWIFDGRWRMGQAALVFHDYSAPHTHPILNAHGDRALRARLREKMRRAHVVVVPTAMYSHHSKWIGEEIRAADHLGKPILAVNPRGQLRTSSAVHDAADAYVGWNSNSVIAAIWALYYR